jgi:hypothetical protein
LGLEGAWWLRPCSSLTVDNLFFFLISKRFTMLIKDTSQFKGTSNS